MKRNDIQTAEEKLRQAETRLREISEEAKSLPARIAEAVKAGNSKELTSLRKRQIEVDSEVFCAQVAHRQCGIDLLEAENAEAGDRAEEMTEQRAKELPLLEAEMAELQARLRQIPLTVAKLHDTTNRAQAKV